MKIQKMSITNMVNKCLLLIKQFKSEQEHANSILIKQTPNDLDITHRKLFEQLTELEESMQKYMILSVQSASELGKEVLDQKILGQTVQMSQYSRMVENIKEENKTVYRDIYSVLLDSQQPKQPVRQLCEFKPDFNLRPAPLTSNSTLMETHQFYDQFSKYIKSSYSVPDGIIYAQAGVHMDRFWFAEIKISHVRIQDSRSC